MGLTKAQLEQLNDSSFPNNNAGAITPAILRNYNDEVIINTVNQDVYSTDSASFDSRIDGLTFDSSSLLTTASFNQYTASNDSKINNLNTISASYLTFTQSYYVDSASFDSRINNVIAGTGFVGTASFNAYTASTNSEISAIETFTASVSTSVGLLQTFSSSQYKLDSASFSVRIEGIDDDNVTTASFNSYTQSTNLFTASISTSVGLLQTFSASSDSRYVRNSQTSSMAVSSSTYSITSSYALNAQTASEARNVIVIARNGNQSTLAAGTVVHITSAVGDNPIFNTASYDVESLSSNTLGILRSSTTSGADGEVVVNGIVTGVNTNPTSGYVAGQLVYLGANGAFTNVQPQAPQQIVTLGQVLRAQQNQGSLYVSINNGWELEELHNVQITNPQTNNLLVYESASYGLWKNKSIGTLGIATTGSNTFVGNQIISGNLAVAGNLTAYSASFISVTSSVVLGGNTIVLNTFLPAVRYGGIEVIDSGSTGLTGSLLWDSLNDNWIYVNPSGSSYVSAKLISGPQSQTLGNEPGLVNNYIVKAVGDDHISSSQITDDGTTVRVQNELSASTFTGLGNLTQYSASVSSRINSISGSTINTGSFATTGSNTFLGLQTIQDNALHMKGQYPFVQLASNAEGSGSEFANIELNVDSTLYSNTYSGISINNRANNNTFLLAGIATSTFTPEFGGEYVGLIAGGGTNINGSSTAIIFRTGSGDMYVFKPTSFAFGVNVTGSAVFSELTGSLGGFSASLNSRLLAATGSTVDTSSLVTTASFNSYTSSQDFKNTTFATTGSNVFVGKETISGSIEMNLGSTIRFYQQSSSVDGLRTSQLRFYTEPSASTNNRWLNIQAVPGVSNTVAIADFPSNNHFTFYDLDGHTITNEATIVNKGNQLNLNGALQVANYQEFNLQAVSPTVFQGVGTSSVAYEQFINGGNYDGVHIQSNINAGTDFQDIPSDTFTLNTWLNIPTNTGNHPAPQFKRGLGITGSVSVTGSTTIIGNQTISGSLILSSSADVELTVVGRTVFTGSIQGNIVAVSVASSTASIDFSQGNFFTLTIPSSSVTYITGSNLRPGVTANIILTQQSTTGSVRFEPTLFRFPSGSINTGSAVVNAVDMVSVAGISSTTLYSVTARQLI